MVCGQPESASSLFVDSCGRQSITVVVVLKPDERVHVREQCGAVSVDCSFTSIGTPILGLFLLKPATLRFTRSYRVNLVIIIIINIVVVFVVDIIPSSIVFDFTIDIVVDIIL